MSNTYTFKIFRGDPKYQYWEEFELLRHPAANVISALMEIQKNPVNKAGESTTPVVWEQGCLEEVCGSCSMLINGKPRQACTALIESYIQETGSTILTLAPLTKFPLIRDLYVDRSSLFEALKKVSAWISVDMATDGDAFGPLQSQQLQEVLYILSKCMTCGCCSEGCPQVNQGSPFMGPAAMSQVRLFNAHPVGSLEKAKRLRAILSEEGISGCGNAQNCIRVCPKEIPLTESIALIGRTAFQQAIKDFLGLPDQQ